MGRVTEAEMDRRRRRLLALILDGGADGAALSKKAMAQAMGLSPTQARSLVKSLEKGGLVSVRPRFGTDGGQLANAHFVTERGLCWLLARCGAEGRGARAERGSKGREARRGSVERKARIWTPN